MQHKNMKTASGDDIILFGIGLDEERFWNFRYTQDAVWSEREIQARRVLMDFAIGRDSILTIQAGISADDLLFVIEKYHLGRNGLSPTLYKAACFNIYLDCIGFYSPLHPSYTKYAQYRWMKNVFGRNSFDKANGSHFTNKMLKSACANMEKHKKLIKLYEEKKKEDRSECRRIY
jgi:hypothetical protein